MKSPLSRVANITKNEFRKLVLGIVAICSFSIQTAATFAQGDCAARYITADSLYRVQEYAQADGLGELYPRYCANSDSSWKIFALKDSTVLHLAAKDSSLWIRYRNWLQYALWLDTADHTYSYYCADVKGIVLSFQYNLVLQGIDLAASMPGINNEVGVIDYLLSTDRCPHDSAFFFTWRSKLRLAQIKWWKQWETNDTNYIDSTVPNIDTIGWKILRANPVLLSVPKEIQNKGSGILQAFSLSENPFQSNTLLRFNLNSMAYVRTEVFDELGRMVLGDGSGKVYESGQHKLPIDLSKFASGAYYLRISLADGEARTLKLVKQE